MIQFSRVLKIVFILVAFVASSSVVAIAQTGETKRTWTATELWSESVSEGLVLSNGAIMLEENLLIENDAERIGSIRSEAWDTISSGNIFRKYLTVSELPVKKAILTMMVYPVYPEGPMSGGKLKFTINGHRSLICEVRHAWTNVPIPKEYLKPGKNLIEVTVHGKDVQFRTPRTLDSDHHFSKGSKRSSDNGKSWTGVNGEYPIRLKLQSFHHRGMLRTPVINLAEPEIKGVMLLPASVESSKFRFDLSQAGGTQQIRMRSGNTHQPEAGGWSDWKKLDNGMLPKGFRDRFVQLEISFGSNTNNQSARLHAFSIQSHWKSHQAVERDRILIKQVVNKPLIRSSYPFQHEDPSLPALQNFRKKFCLDEVVKGASTEMEKIKLLRGWVAGLWDWYLPDTELPDQTAWNAMEILNQKNKEGAPGKIGGYCLHYAIVFAQACQSLGIPARIVTVNYSIWGGHEVTEVWSREYEKWIMMDAQFDAMFYNRQTRIPCSVLELHQVFLDTYYPGSEIINRDKWTIEDRNRRSENINPDSLPIAMELGGKAHSGQLGKDYVWWKVAFDMAAPGYSGGYGFFNTAEVRWLPRSNWLSQPAPMPVTHGRTHWGWTGYLCWTDSKTPESAEHRYFVRRQSDIYPRLFTVDFRIEPISEGLLRVMMATDSPGFSYFEIIENGVKRKIRKGDYIWKVIPGENKLEIRSVDAIGNRGSASKLSIDYLPKEQSYL